MLFAVKINPTFQKISVIFYIIFSIDQCPKILRTIDIILASEIIFMLQYTTMFCELLLYGILSIYFSRRHFTRT